MGRIPRPVPDYKRLPSYHYKPVNDTPSENEDGSLRKPDDFMPRAQLRKDFSAGELTLNDPRALETFADKYIVDQEYVIQYIQHLQDLEWTKTIRSKTKQIEATERRNKTVHGYNWQKLLDCGRIR